MIISHTRLLTKNTISVLLLGVGEEEQEQDPMGNKDKTHVQDHLRNKDKTTSFTVEKLHSSVTQSEISS